MESSEVQIEAADVIRLIQQFLKENHLHSTLRALQEETTVVLNAVENVDAFRDDIMNGRWDVVLQTISQLRLPQAKLIDLYEQIILELAEQRELQAARSMLRQTEPMQVLKQRAHDRYIHLEQVIGRTFFDAHEAYPAGSSKERRRAAIADALISEVGVVPPGRLMTLLHQSLRWQQFQGLLPPGGQFDLLRGVAPGLAAQEDAPPMTPMFSIHFGKSHAECARFSPDGHLLVTGSVDGLIEVWSAITGKLRKDLKYQEEDLFMMLDSAVLALAFSRDGELLAAGGHDGTIKVFNIATGALVRRLPAAHAQAVTCLAFSRDGTSLLSGSNDATLRLHGLRTGKLLREFRGHTSFVNSVAFASSERIYSSSSDGTVRVWDARTGECLAALRPRHRGTSSGHSGASAPSIITALPLPRNPEHMIVVDRTAEVTIMTAKGQTLAAMAAVDESAVATAPPFVAADVSFRGQYALCAAEDRKVYCFNLENGKLEASFQVQNEKEVVGMVAHPTMPIAVTFGTDGSLRAWKASS